MSSKLGETQEKLEEFGSHQKRLSLASSSGKNSISYKKLTHQQYLELSKLYE